MKTKKTLRYVSAIVLLLFGAVTLFLSTSIFLDLFDIRAKEGNYVLFVVWSNFIASILYLLSVYGFIKLKSWTKLVLGAASLVLIVSFIFLQVHISNGGIHETKTVYAMIFRITLTVVFALLAAFTIQKNQVEQIR
ncbi:MAG: hypothetical protein K9G46_09810 [Flavobacteriales bacterium]|jgi:drug/metabolite transporter (DMT)-like permease|nr:hypothetical protein [Flavobacteriales bacterium]